MMIFWLIIVIILAIILVYLYATKLAFRAWVKRVWGWLLIIGAALAAAAATFWDQLQALWS